MLHDFDVADRVTLACIGTGECFDVGYGSCICVSVVVVGNGGRVSVLGFGGGDCD